MHITDYEKTQSLNWEDLFILDGGDRIGTRTVFAGILARELFKLMEPDAMADALNILQMTEAQKVLAEDRLILGTQFGSKSLKVADFYKFLDGFIKPESRRYIFRGKKLGNSVSDEQWEEIKTGRYHDMFIGDYWESSDGTRYRIADFNYWLFSFPTWPPGSESNIVADYHLVLTQDNNCHRSKMFNTPADMTGSFVHSVVYTGIIPLIDTYLASFFGEEHLLTHTAYLSNGFNFSNGTQTGLWYNVKSQLPTVNMIFGSNAPLINTEYLDTSAQKQLALYNLTHTSGAVPIGMAPETFARYYWLPYIYFTGDPDPNKNQWQAIIGNGVYGSIAVSNPEMYVKPVFAIYERRAT